jgi:tetratricopeptide (TPR) repeat protein
LDKLFGKQFGAYGYTDYAHGWTFVHFLMESADYSKKFKKYFRDLYTLKGKFKQYAKGKGTRVFISPAEVGEHLLAYLKKADLKELEGEWISFVRDEMVAEGGRGYFYLGRDMSMQGRAEEALKNLSKAIEELGYATPRAHYFRAKTYRSLGQREEAIAEVRVALDKDPTNAEFRVYLASLLPKKEKVEAVRQLKLACELEPDDATYPWRLEQFRANGRLFIF